MAPGHDLVTARQGATFAYTVPLSGTTATTVTQPATVNLDTENRRAFSGGDGQIAGTPSTRVHISTGLRLNVTWERHGESAGSTHVRPAGRVGAIFGLWEQGTNHARLFANDRDTFKPAAFDFSLAPYSFHDGTFVEFVQEFGGTNTQLAGQRF